MCESQAESYRVEDTMNKILSLSQAAFASAVLFQLIYWPLLTILNLRVGLLWG